jgi:hypothetical protein
VSDLAQAIAIVAFTALIGIEWYADRVRARRLGRRAGYPFYDSLTNVSIGLGAVLFGGIAVLQGVTVHAYLDEHAALVMLPEDSVWAWVGITVAVDFCFYWSHRAMHRVNLLWTIHAPHHQSEEFDFSSRCASRGSRCFSAGSSTCRACTSSCCIRGSSGRWACSSMSSTRRRTTACTTARRRDISTGTTAES